MNKELAIKKINKIGKIGKIISVICLAFVILGLIGTTFGGIIISTFPKKGLEVERQNLVTVKINMSEFDEDMENMTQDEIIESVKRDIGFDVSSVNMSDGNIMINGEERVYTNVEVVEGSVVLTSEPAETKANFNNIVKAVIFSDIFFVAAIVSLIFVRNLCVAFEKCETPFAESVISKMRAFAFSLIPFAILSSIPSMIYSNLFGDKVNINLSLNLGVIFMVLIILGISYIFKYGAVLQQESDETL